MIQKQHLLNFIERLNTHQIIRTHSFFSLYNEWFFEVTHALKDEILENLSLTTTDKKDYLKYVMMQISEKIVYQNNSKLLDKWIKKFKLYNFKFPFVDDGVAQCLLDADIKDSSLDYNYRKDCTNMQFDFYCHAAMIEKYKMIAFINDLASTGRKKHYTDEAWFKFGVQLASGNLSKYYDINSSNTFIIKEGFSARKIAEELGLQKSNNIISGTLNNYSKELENSNRNIFNNRSKISTITEYCAENNISIVPEFLNRIPPE